MTAKDTPGKLKRLQARARAFIEETDDVSEGSMSRWGRFARFWLLAIKSFVRNRCPVRASALAYTTLLSLIPVLAVVVGVSSSFLKSQGEEPVKKLLNQLVDNMAPQLGLVPKAKTATGDASAAAAFPETDAREEVVLKITEYIGRIQSGTLGLTGVASLILVAILLLSTIEATFNDIWGVVHGRSWFARVVQYWAAITLGPLFLLLAIGLTSVPQIAATHQWLNSIPVIGSRFSMVLPFFFLSAGFALFYALMPNTKVDWKAACVGGMVGGGLWQLNNLFNILYVSKVVSYSKIYGSFAVVPVFLVGVYFSWLILLFGAQVAYAFQNRRGYLQAKQADAVNQQGREFVALRLMTRIGESFLRGEPPMTPGELGDLLGVPSRLIAQLAQPLLKARLLVEVNLGEPAYHPGRPLEKITPWDILHALRTSQGTGLSTRDDPARASVSLELERIRQAEEQAASRTNLRDLAQSH